MDRCSSKQILVVLKEKDCNHTNHSGLMMSTAESTRKFPVGYYYHLIMSDTTELYDLSSTEALNRSWQGPSCDDFNLTRYSLDMLP